MHMRTLDLDAIISDITAQYETYGKEGSEPIKKAYEYARKCHE